MSKLQEKPSALKHPTRQNIKFHNFFYICGSSHFALLDPDSESRSNDLNESGSGTLFLNLKLDTKHWDGSGIRKKLIPDPGI
jgi:hypothetical protein